MMDGQGRQSWALELDIYGKARPGTQLGTPNACPFRYPGQYEDEETGLYYNRFRYYDPEGGGYVSQDPIGLAGNNPTLYGYVGDPLVLTDKLGLACGADDYQKISKKQAYNTFRARGLDHTNAKSMVNSFKGPIFARRGQKFEKFVVTESHPGSASKVFVTNSSAGATASERIDRLALPPWNSANHEGVGELTREQLLIEGHVAPQPSWGAGRNGGGWQVVTDGGVYTGAVQ